MKVGNKTIDFYKIPNIKLTRFFTAYQGFQMKMVKGLNLKNLTDEKEILEKDIPVDQLIDIASRSFEIVNESFYEPMRNLFFKNSMIVGYGLASDPVIIEKVLDEEGLDFEFILFTEAVKNYLGGSLAKVGERGKLLQQEKQDIQTPTLTK